MSLYYFTNRDGEVEGPAELMQIRREIAEGMLEASTKLSTGGSGQWMTLAEAEALEKASAPSVSLKQAMAARREQGRPREGDLKSVMAPRLAVIGLVSVVVGSLLAFLGLMRFTQDDARAGYFMVIGLSSILSGVLFFAGAEALKFLAIIAGKK